MMKIVRSQVALAATFLLAGAMSFAQEGAAIYKTKCLMCHGATGTPSPAMAKAMGIKPASDPAIKKLTVAQIESVVKSGSANKKMKPVAGLNDAQVKAVAEYFKTLK